MIVNIVYLNISLLFEVANRLSLFLVTDSPHICGYCDLLSLICLCQSFY